MHFMLMIKADENFEAGRMPEPREKIGALMAAIGNFAKDMTERGILVAQGGLTPSRQGVRIHASGGKLTEVDGPFAETKELIAGYAMIKVGSKEEATEVARQFMKLHQDVLGPAWEGIGEVRQISGPDDCEA